MTPIFGKCSECGGTCNPLSGQCESCQAWPQVPHDRPKEPHYYVATDQQGQKLVEVSYAQWRRMGNG